MTEKLLELREWLDQRNPRERVLILLSAIALLFAVFDLALLSPLAEESATLATQTRAVESEFREIGEQIRRLGQGLTDDATSEVRARVRALEQQLEALDAQLADETIQLVSPDKMVRVFEDLLRRSGDLRLIRLETQSPEALFEAASDETSVADNAAAVFQHGLVIELEGSFRSTLRYLEAVEQLPWHLFWDRLQYRVLDHPTARVILRVHTLSTREGWLRV